MTIQEVSATASEKHWTHFGGVSSAVLVSTGEGQYAGGPTEFQRTKQNRKVGAYFGNFGPGNFNGRRATPVVGGGEFQPKQSYPSVRTTLQENPQTTQNASFILRRQRRNYEMIFANTRLKHKALCCRNDSSMRAIRTGFVLSR
jgi:hypothetical protein